MPATRASPTSARPTTSPGPVTTCSAPGGTPASHNASAAEHRRHGALLRRFQHDGVARDQRGRGRRDRERHREVERRDHAPHAVRPHDVERRLVRREPAHRLLEPAVLAHLVAVVADEVGGLLDVAERLEAVLPDLHRHRRRQLRSAVPRSGRRPRSSTATRSAHGVARHAGAYAFAAADRVADVRRGSRSRPRRARTSWSAGDRTVIALTGPARGRHRGARRRPRTRAARRGVRGRPRCPSS